MSERETAGSGEASATDADRTTAVRSEHPSAVSDPASGRTVVPAEIEPPSDDVARAPATAALPGEHRGGFQREMTQPLPVAPPLEVHPDPAQASDPQAHWIHPPPTLPRSAGWGLLFGILGLTLSFFVGWGFPVGLIGLVLAILALRRPWERCETAVWALALSVASLVFSAGWLWWAHSQGALFA